MLSGFQCLMETLNLRTRVTAVAFEEGWFSSAEFVADLKMG